jgi:hypothetical protein
VIITNIYTVTILKSGRSQWPRGLRSRSVGAWLLGSHVRIHLGVWMFCILCFHVVLSCLCDGLITRPEESYRVSNVCVITETPKGALCSKLGTTGKLMNGIEIRVQHHLQIQLNII